MPLSPFPALPRIFVMKHKVVLLKIQYPLSPHLTQLAGHGAPVHTEILSQLLAVMGYVKISSPFAMACSDR